MPYRPEAELKRPDLKGEFTCGVCYKRFCHAASLNRHRLNFHSGNHHCKLCDMEIPNGETLKSHMSFRHAIDRVFTCGCCNWAFPDKKELHQHTSSMLKTGDPGTAQPIATNLNVAPGSMVAEKSPGVFPRTPASSSGESPSHPGMSSPPKGMTPVSSRVPTTTLFGATAEGTNTVPTMAPMSQIELQQQLLQALAFQLQNNSAAAPAWLRAFMMNNPVVPSQIFKKICTNNNAAAMEGVHSEDEHQSTSSASTSERVCVVKREQTEGEYEMKREPVDTEFVVKKEVYYGAPSESSLDTLSPSISVEAVSPAPLTDTGSSDGDTPPPDMHMMHSPGVGKKRKRTIDDVVSFLHKKQTV